MSNDIPTKVDEITYPCIKLFISLCFPTTRSFSQLRFVLAVICMYLISVDHFDGFV